MRKQSSVRFMPSAYRVYFMPRKDDGEINWSVEYTMASILHTKEGKEYVVDYYVAHIVTSKVRKGVRHEIPTPKRLMQLARTQTKKFGKPTRILESKQW